MGLFKADLDQMELWEIGETFGLRPDGTIDEPEDGKPKPAGPRQVISPEFLAERARARAEGREPPLPPVVSP